MAACLDGFCALFKSNVTITATRSDTQTPANTDKTNVAQSARVVSVRPSWSGGAATAVGAASPTVGAASSARFRSATVESAISANGATPRLSMQPPNLSGRGSRPAPLLSIDYRTGSAGTQALTNSKGSEDANGFVWPLPNPPLPGEVPSQEQGGVLAARGFIWQQHECIKNIVAQYLGEALWVQVLAEQVWVDREATHLAPYVVVDAEKQPLYHLIPDGIAALVFASIAYSRKLILAFQVKPWQFRQITALSDLCELQFEASQLNDRDFAFSSISTLNQLEKLTLTRARELSSAIIPNLARLRRLKELEFTEAPLIGTPQMGLKWTDAARSALDQLVESLRNAKSRTTALEMVKCDERLAWPLQWVPQLRWPDRFPQSPSSSVAAGAAKISGSVKNLIGNPAPASSTPELGARPMQRPMTAAATRPPLSRADLMSRGTSSESSNYEAENSQSQQSQVQVSVQS